MSRKYTTNTELKAMLERIENKIERKSRIGRLDTLFVIGLSLVVASIPMMAIEQLRDRFISYSFLFLGALLMIGTDYLRSKYGLGKK